MSKVEEARQIIDGPENSELKDRLQRRLKSIREPEEPPMQEEQILGPGIPRPERWIRITSDEGEITVPDLTGYDPDDIISITRSILDSIILRDGRIRPNTIEHQWTWAGVHALESQAIIPGTSNETKQKAQDLRMEYEAIRHLLDWWQVAVRGETGGQGMGREFGTAINIGSRVPAKYLTWLKDNYRGKDFLEGFAHKRGQINPDGQQIDGSEFDATSFTNASEYLGAMLRAGSGVGVHDAPKGRDFELADGTKILVVNQKGELLTTTKPGTGVIYELFKQLALDSYAGYTEVRFHWIDLAFELVGSTVHPETLERVPVYRCHISPDSLWAYNAFQHPGYLGEFWFDLLQKVKDPKEAFPDSKVRNDFLKFRRQLGWNDRLTYAQNIALLGTAEDFIDLPVTETGSRRRNLPPELNKQALGWDQSQSDDENLIRLGLLRKHGGHDYGKYIAITENLMNLDTEDIPAEVWALTDWDLLPQHLMTNWAQQMGYLQETRNAILNILTGGKINEGLEHLKNPLVSFIHIHENIGWVAERERTYWRSVIDRAELLSLRRYREKGVRHELATMIRSKVPEGFLRGMFRRLYFSGCGIRNMDWSENMVSIQNFQRVRQFLQCVNERKVVRDGLKLADKGLNYQDLANYAGLKIRKWRKEPILMLTDENGDWDTPRNRGLLAILKEYINLPNDKARKKWIEDNPEKSKLALGVWEEWQTEVDPKLIKKFLNLPADQRRQWVESLPEDEVEKIFQVWPEFEEMTPQEHRAWFHSHPRVVEAVSQMTLDWPSRALWDWGQMLEAGTGQPATGAEQLEMATWGTIENFIGTSYEKRPKPWPWRRWGPKFDLWEREKRIYRTARRQKLAIDLRSDREKSWLTIRGQKVHDPHDRIIGRWRHDQLEWDPASNSLNRHDRPVDPFGRADLYQGVDRLASMMMGTGEYYPGDPREVSPLWYGHDTKRLIYRYFSRFSIGYKEAQAKLAAIVYNFKDWKEYWSQYQLQREVLAPSKMFKIIRLLFHSGAIDPNEVTEYQPSFGATKQETIAYWSERKSLRLPDEEDVVKEGVEPDIKKAWPALMAELKVPGVSPIVGIISGGRTGKEIKTMVRNAALLGSLPIGISTFGLVLTGSTLGWWALPLSLGLAGLGAYAGLDRGDNVSGFNYWLGKLGGLLREREARSDPEALKRGYVLPGVFKLIPKWFINFPLVRIHFQPAINDDTINASEIADAIAKSKAQLGGAGFKK